MITGSEALSHSQMADIFTQRLGKKVVHISPSAEEYKEGLVKMNVPDFLHDFLAELYSTIAKGQWAHVSDDYTLLTGKSATTFNDFVEENRKIFLGTKEPAAAVAR